MTKYINKLKELLGNRKFEGVTYDKVGNPIIEVNNLFNLRRLIRDNEEREFAAKRIDIIETINCMLDIFVFNKKIKELNIKNRKLEDEFNYWNSEPKELKRTEIVVDLSSLIKTDKISDLVTALIEQEKLGARVKECDYSDCIILIREESEKEFNERVSLAKAVYEVEALNNKERITNLMKEVQSSIDTIKNKLKELKS